MFVCQSFFKRAPVTDGTVFEFINNGSWGFSLGIENQDPEDGNTLVYSIEASVDGGTTWEVIEFPLEGGGTATQFALIAQDAHLVKITTAGRIRMVAHGDLPVGVSLHHFRRSTTGTGPVSIVNQ